MELLYDKRLMPRINWTTVRNMASAVVQRVAPVVIRPKFTVIVACDPKGIMGKDGRLPWDVPEDKQYFRDKTRDHVMIMGHKTFASIPETTLRGRACYVFSREHQIDRSLATPVRDWEEFQKHQEELRNRKNFVIGGAEVLQLFFSQGWVDEAEITLMKQQYEGDVQFPIKWFSQVTSWQKEVICETDKFSRVLYRSSPHSNK